MDLAIGAKSVRVMTNHTTRDGAHKLLRTLSLPSTAPRVVDRVYSNLAVLEPRGDHFLVVEVAPGIDELFLAHATGAPLRYRRELESRPFLNN